MKFNRLLAVLADVVKVSWERHIEYRGAALMWILNGFMVPVILTLIWLTIRSHQQLPLDQSQIITYFFLSTITVRLTQSWTAERLGWQIKEGMFSQYLLRPVPYWLNFLGVDLGLKGVRMVSLAPFVGLFLIFFGSRVTVSFSPELWLLVIVSLILGYLINFVIQNIIGLTALWLEHVYGLYTIYNTLEGLFGGYTIPLALMPSLLAGLTVWLPFRYILGFPIDMAMETIGVMQIFKGFLILLMWLVLLVLAWRGVYKLGIKNYTAVGN